MAGSDITFGIGLELNENDLKKTVHSMQDVANQIEKIFERTASVMTKKLADKNATTSLGMAGIEPAVEKNFRALENRVSSLFPKMKNPRASLEKLYKKEGRPNTLDKLERLEKIATYLAPYDQVYAGINTLRDKAAADSIDPTEGQGVYGVLQRYINRFRGHLYNANLSVPDVITRKVLEAGEYYRDINLKSGSMFRSALRYVQDKSYTESSLSRAGDYLLMTGQGGLQELSDIYGFNLGSDSSSVPSRVSAKAQNILTRWAQLGLSAKEHKDIILRGGLSKSAKAAEIDIYAQYMRDFISLQKKLFPEERGIHDSLKKLLKTDLLKFKGGGSGGAGSGVWTAIAGKATRDIFQGGVSMLESYWGESITRNAYASRQAYLSRWTTGGEVAGSIIGAVLAGAATGFNPVAMGVGYSAGGKLGRLPGTYSETKYKSDIGSASDMMGRIRNKALWGNEYNTYFAKALTDVGIANGESAMGGLADKAMSFRARMMLGQVGEQEMLYMSMVPNFYAALMAGVTGPELLNIYKRDLDAIGDPSMRYLVGQSVGNSEAFAAARNPYFNDMYGTLVGKTGLYERAASGMQYGFYRGRVTAADETLDRDIKEIFYSARRGDKTIYQGELENKSWQKFIDAASSLSKLGGLTGTVLNVVVQLDGADIARATQTIDGPDTYVNSLQSFSIGG